MKTLKIIAGILAALFALAHAVTLIVILAGPQRPQGAYSISYLMGHVAGLIIGVIVAVICFRPAKPKTP